MTIGSKLVVVTQNGIPQRPTWATPEQDIRVSLAPSVALPGSDFFFDQTPCWKRVISVEAVLADWNAYQPNGPLA